MRNSHNIVDFLLGDYTPAGPNVPFYLMNMQRLLQKEGGCITAEWMQQMFQSAVAILLKHDIIFNPSLEPRYQSIIVADDATLERVLSAILSEVSFLENNPESHNPGYHEDVLRIHLDMARAMLAYEHNSWEAHTVNPILRIAARLLLRTEAWGVV